MLLHICDTPKINISWKLSSRLGFIGDRFRSNQWFCIYFPTSQGLCKSLNSVHETGKFSYWHYLIRFCISESRSKMFNKNILFWDPDFNFSVKQKQVDIYAHWGLRERPFQDFMWQSPMFASLQPRPASRLRSKNLTSDSTMTIYFILCSTSPNRYV